MFARSLAARSRALVAASVVAPGIDEVRIAYVLNIDDLNRALIVLQKALEAYPGRREV